MAWKERVYSDTAWQSNRAQGHIVTVGCQVDARVALLEMCFRGVDAGRQRPPPNNTSRATMAAGRGTLGYLQKS